MDWYLQDGEYQISKATEVQLVDVPFLDLHITI